jgi:hypothetical protein
MASVLDTVTKTTKALSPAPKKIAKAIKIQDEAKAGRAETEAGQTEAEAGPLVPSEMKAAALEDKADQQTSETDLTVEQDMAEKAKETPATEAPAKAIDYIYQHALGKKLSKDEIAEARHYAQKLKYLKGALVFNDSNEDDFLYCLPDNK